MSLFSTDLGNRSKVNLSIHNGSRVLFNDTQPRPSPPKTRAELTKQLNELQQELAANADDNRAFNGLMEELFLKLHDTRNSLDPAVWKDEFVPEIRMHPLRKMAHEDPFTYRAFSKPRGYAGDARMLDYIYGREEFWDPPAASELGKRIFEFTTQSPASLGVLARREYISHLLDNFAMQIDSPDVLSIASGHSREAEMTAAFRRRKFGRFVALDGDDESLVEASNCYGKFGMTTVHAKIGKLITGRLDVGRFDLVYSTGLFDYLGDPTARRLVKVMFNMLNPGGRLVIANFMPEIRDTGYMESIMDWWLIYRTREDMIRTTAEIPLSEIGEIRIEAEENQNIVFMEVQKR